MPLIPLPDLSRESDVGRGGFGVVKTHPGRPELLVKRFNEPLVGPDCERLKMLAGVLANVRASERQLLLTRFSWPIELFGDSSTVVGYSMPQAPPTAYFSTAILGRVRQQLLQSKFIFDTGYLTSAAVSTSLVATREQRIVIALDLCRALTALHQLDLVYLDISSNNVCVQLEEVPRVFFLDADSIRSSTDRSAEVPESPDWDVDPDFDLLQIDRAKAAVFIWRLFTEHLTFYPKQNDSALVNRNAGFELAGSLLGLFATGNEQAMSQVIVDLQLALGQVELARVVERDQTERFARPLKFWHMPALRPEDRELLHRAEAFCAAERRADEASGFEGRVRLRVLRSGAEFNLDPRPASVVSPPMSTIEDLERLISVGEFGLVAEQLSRSGLGDLEAHGWVERATQHALLHVPVSVPEVTSSAERATVRWHWDQAPWVTAAALDVGVGGVWAREIVPRPLNALMSERVLLTPPAADIEVRVSPAVTSPAGLVVVGPVPGVHRFRSPDLPPTLRQIPRLSTGDPNFFVGDPQLVSIIDPVAERARLEEHRRRRRRSYAGRGLAAFLAVSALAFAGWFVWQPEARNPRVEYVAKGAVLRWSLPDSVGAGNPVVVERSDDGGITWSTAATVDPRFGGLVIPYRRGLGRRAYRVTAGTDFTSPIGEPVTVIDDVQPPTEVRSATVARESDAYALRWVAVESVGAPIDRYEVRYGIRRADGGISWTDGFVIEVGGEPTERYLHRLITNATGYVFRIRAVNLAGVAGPWTEPSPI